MGTWLMTTSLTYTQKEKVITYLKNNSQRCLMLRIDVTDGCSHCSSAE